jgi:MoaA/NifB/PqqE/SkfB family radical SAM enzyme
MLPDRCTKPWSWPTLRYDGTVLFCECGHTMANMLGNAFTSSFRDIWLSEHAAKLRGIYPRNGKVGFEFCRRCRYKIDDSLSCS